MNEVGDMDLRTAVTALAEMPLTATTFRLAVVELLQRSAAPPQPVTVFPCAEPAVEDSAPPVRIKFQSPSGRTTICLKQALVMEVAVRLGGQEEARRHIRQIALNAPVAVANRSRWVRERLVHWLVDSAKKEVLPFER